MMPEPVEALLFDKDGTLFAFHQTWVPINHAAALSASNGDRKLAQSLLKAAGYDPDRDDIVPDGLLAAGNTVEIAHCWNAVLASHHRSGQHRQQPTAENPSLEEIVARIETVYRREGPRRSVPVTDLPALFAELTGAGYVLGLATSDSAAAAEDTLRHFGLKDYFALVAGYDSGFGIKPDPGMVSAFCTRIGVSAEAVAVIGDTPHDMQMGRRAGVGCVIGVLTGAGRAHDLRPLADHVIPDIAALRGLLKLSK